MTLTIGQRVRHDCDDPRCTLEGNVVSLGFFDSMTLGGHDGYYEWALVDVDLSSQKDKDGVPHAGTYRQWFPVAKLRPIAC